MNSLMRIWMVTALSAGILTHAEAQRTRGESRGDRGPRVSSGASRNNSPSVRSATRRDAPVRTFDNNRNNTVQRTSRPNTAGRESRPAERIQQRNPDGNNSRGGSVASRGDYAMRGGRDGNRYTNYGRYNGTYRNNNRYSYGNYRYRSGYYGNVYGRRTAFMYGPRYRVIPHSFISIHFGGHPYYYNAGYYYGYYGGFYQPIFPPFGLRIGVLPYGCARLYIGPDPFYYYNGIYYRQYAPDTYEVVDAPMGATVSSLPSGARSVVINGEDLYELNGTYYKADRDAGGNDVFVVVGKNGVINNSTDMESNAPLGPSDGTSVSPLHLGDIISQLPEGSKIVTINGAQMYETPDDVYLQQETSNGVIQYRVVGN